MKNFQISKLLNLKLLILASVFFVAACDKFPQLLRRSENEAKKHYYEWEADDQDVEAMYMAAKANCCGEDKFSDNDVKALNMFCKAAQNGHKASMLEVGKLYLNERTIEATVIPYDPALAFTYFSMSEQAGHEHAEYYREKLLNELNEEEFARATRLIDSFPVVPCEITR